MHSQRKMDMFSWAIERQDSGAPKRIRQEMRETLIERPERIKGMQHKAGKLAPQVLNDQVRLDNLVSKRVDRTQVNELNSLLERKDELSGLKAVRLAGNIEGFLAVTYLSELLGSRIPNVRNASASMIAQIAKAAYEKEDLLTVASLLPVCMKLVETEKKAKEERSDPHLFSRALDVIIRGE